MIVFGVVMTKIYKQATHPYSYFVHIICNKLGYWIDSISS